MKQIDELIEKYLRLNFNNDTVDLNDVINDLEQLKAELKDYIFTAKHVSSAYYRGKESVKHKQ